MGVIWLRELDDWLRAEGLPFREWPDWRTRGRSSGGFDAVWGIVAHHTGSNTSWTNDCLYCWQNAGDRPIGNVHLDRAGVVTIGAAGATNTNGRGLAPWQTSKGVIPIEPTSMGNRMAFAIEAASNGVGERWPRVQMDVYLRLMAMLCRRLGLDPLRDVTTHRGWAGLRKTDPFGPAEGYPELGSQTWPVDALRSLVAAAVPVPTPDPPPPPPPVPPPPPIPDLEQEEITMWLIGRTSDTGDRFLAAPAVRAGAFHVPSEVPRNYPFAAGGGRAFDVGQGAVVTDWGQCKPALQSDLLRYMGAER